MSSVTPGTVVTKTDSSLGGYLVISAKKRTNEGKGMKSDGGICTLDREARKGLDGHMIFKQVRE